MAGCKTDFLFTLLLPTKFFIYYSLSGAAGTSTTARTVATGGQAKPPLVVISGSPIKLTPLSRAGGTLTGAQASTGTGGNITCTLVHVQPFNATTKQNIAPKAGGSPSKQAVPLQLQKIVPISVAATSLAKIQSGTAPQFTLATPTGPATSVRHIAPKVNIVQAVPSGQAVQITPVVRNIAPAEKPVQIPQQVLNLLPLFSGLCCIKQHLETSCI